MPGLQRAFDHCGTFDVRPADDDRKDKWFKAVRQAIDASEENPANNEILKVVQDTLRYHRPGTMNLLLLPAEIMYMIYDVLLDC